jgi:hypothetical protein
MEIAKRRFEEALAVNDSSWEAHFPGIVTSQRALREFDDPGARLASVVLLGAGISLMLLPTILDVAIAAATLVRSYIALLS